jgi:Fe-S-cluster containining protein
MEFACIKCGGCCKSLVPIVILSDIVRWIEVGAEHVLENVVKVRAEGFLKRLGVEYCFAFRRKRGRCVFYEKGLCAIYDIRPVVCQLFPFAFSSKGLTVHPWAERNCLGIKLSAMLSPSRAEKLKVLAEQVAQELLILPYCSTAVEEVLESRSNRRPSLSKARVRVDAV